MYRCALRLVQARPVRAHNSSPRCRMKLVRVRARLPTTRSTRWERFQVTSFFDPDAPSPTSHLHSAEYPHLPTLVRTACLQDSAVLTSARALLTPEPEPAAGQAAERLGRPLPAVIKSRYFALVYAECHLHAPGAPLTYTGAGQKLSSRAVRTPDPELTTCGAVAWRDRSLARVTKS